MRTNGLKGQTETYGSQARNYSVKKESPDRLTSPERLTELELKVSENTPTTSHGHFNTPLNGSDIEDGFNNFS